MCGVSVGISAVLVALMAEKAEVKFDPAYIMPSQIANRVSELGYPASLMETDNPGQGSIDINVSTRKKQHSLVLTWR